MVIGKVGNSCVLMSLNDKLSVDWCKYVTFHILYYWWLVIGDMECILLCLVGTNGYPGASWTLQYLNAVKVAISVIYDEEKV